MTMKETLEKKKEVVSQKAKAASGPVKQATLKGKKKAEEALEKARESETVKKTEELVDKAKASVEPVLNQMKEAAQEAAEKLSARPTIYIQSQEGTEITVQEIEKRVEARTGRAEMIYVKPGENKAYYVKDGETGSVELW